MLFSSFVGAALLSAGTYGQSSTYSQPGVPTGTPVPGNYTGPLRPRVHFSPPQGFMNDPNGLFVDAEGLYHYYYQYNPTDTIAGNQHWGHATSRDLYRWDNQQIAIFPDNATQGIFSGSAVIDMNNTSGFFPNQTNGVVAIYTLNTPFLQTQDIAYSHDNGYTFVKYSGNPVLDIGSKNFRDPKVIWHAPTQKWIMIVSYVREFTVGIFTSANLKNWTAASNFSGHGVTGNQWECPNMVEIPMEDSNKTMYLLYVSINPGAPLGGSIGQYFPGSFNGSHFTSVDSRTRIADFGKDNYAAQFFYGIPGSQPQISIGWASNWQYTSLVPSGPLEGWQSAATLPRTNYLKNMTRLGYTLVSLPHNISAVANITRPLVSNSSLGNGTMMTPFGSDIIPSNSIYFELNATGLNQSTGGGLTALSSLNFTLLSSASGESVFGGQFLSGDAAFFLNRGNTRYTNPFFTNAFSQGTITDGNRDLTLAAVLDRSVFEIFLTGGETSAAISVFPEYPFDTLIVKAAGLNAGAKVSVAVWGLEDTWAGLATNGTVLGNVTASANGTQMARRSAEGADWRFGEWR